MTATELAKQVSIGVLTALPKECAAMRLMLENEVRWQVSGEGGGRDYYLGEIPAFSGRTHVVAIALLPDMGNNSAAISATRLLQHFPSVRHVIMCGIAGGVPKPGDTEHDVRLGDIVVSNRNGVVQYDLIKEGPDGSKEHRYPPRPPGADLLAAVRHLLTEEELGRRPWEPLLARGASLKNGSRPDDNLNARGETVSYPTDRQRIPSQPRVFHSPVAAANILLKNPKYRDYLGSVFGVKAIEMEGSGVADATWSDAAGYLVVRGICDYCDERKGDVWQGAAAVAAAAYVRALISSMPNGTEIRGIGPASPQEVTSEELVRQFMQESLERFEQAVVKRKAKLPLHGAWEVALQIIGRIPAYQPDRSFLRLLDAANPKYTGWPLWLVSESFAEHMRPYPYNQYWEEFIFDENSLATQMFQRKILEFMRFSPQGYFYQRSAFREDMGIGDYAATAMRALDFILPAMNIAEAIAVGIHFAQAMRCNPEGTLLAFTFRWNNLDGRKLVSVNPERTFWPRGPAFQDQVISHVEIPMNTPLSAIGEFVEKVSQPLYHVFDGYALNTSFVREIVRKMLEGKS